MNSKKEKKCRVNVVGHPRISIGMGSHARGVFRSLKAANCAPSLTDIYNIQHENALDSVDDITSAIGNSLDNDVNIFCINADEIEQTLRHMKIDDITSYGSYNIIYPMWELPRFPEEWVDKLKTFQEVWAPSLFVANSLEGQVEKLRHVPISCEVKQTRQRTKRFFNIPDHSFNIMFSFDFLSYIDRKNPIGVIEMYKKIRDSISSIDINLIIKTNNGSKKQKEFDEFTRFCQSQDGIHIIDKTLEPEDVHALMYNIDAYVSLHRSEGFGLGMAEAMCLGVPVICTGWSGNMDFCNKENSVVVDYNLVELRRGQYPHWENQYWADPVIDDAADKLLHLIKDRSYAKSIILEAKKNMIVNHSYGSIGQRYKNIIEDISNNI